MTRILFLFWLATLLPVLAGAFVSAQDQAEDPLKAVKNFKLPERADFEVIERAAFSPDGHRVIATTSRGNVWIWDRVKGENPRKWKVTRGELLTGAVLSLAFSPDGKNVLFGCADDTVRLWDFEAGKEIYCLKGHDACVWSVIFFKDGKRALSGSQGDNIIIEWDLQKGKEARRFQAKGWPSSLSLSADERFLVTPESTEVRIWDLKSGKAERLFEGHAYRVWGAYFTQDGSKVVSASLGEIRVWDVKTGKSLAKFGDGDSLVRGVAISPDGSRLLLGGAGEVQLWDVAARKLMKRIDKLPGAVSVALSPDGGHALSAAIWDDVQLWKLPNNESSKSKQ